MGYFTLARLWARLGFQAEPELSQYMWEGGGPSYLNPHPVLRGPPQSKLAMKVHECTWTSTGFHGKKKSFPLPLGKIRLNQNSPWGPRGPHTTGVRGIFSQLDEG